MSESRVYLIELRCPDHGDVCGETTTFAIDGPKIPADQDAPLPDVETCPKCGGPFDADLESDVIEVREAVVVDPLAEMAEILDRFYGGDSSPEEFRDLLLDEADVGETAIEQRARRARQEYREEFIEKYGVDPEDLDVGEGSP